MSNWIDPHPRWVVISKPKASKAVRSYHYLLTYSLTHSLLIIIVPSTLNPTGGIKSSENLLLFTRSLTHLFTYLLTHSLTHNYHSTVNVEFPLTASKAVRIYHYVLTHLLTHFFTYSLICLLTHSLTHSLIIIIVLV